MGKNIFDFGYDFAELFEFTPGSQRPILKLFAQAFEGIVSQK